jgi:hypothetical protein
MAVVETVAWAAQAETWRRRWVPHLLCREHGEGVWVLNVVTKVGDWQDIVGQLAAQREVDDCFGLGGLKASECESDQSSSFGTIVCITRTAWLTIFPTPGC